MGDQEKYQKAIAFAGYAHRNQLVPGKEYSQRPPALPVA
jgi:hypothetical protein